MQQYQHNRHRQYALFIERNTETKIWDKRVTIFIWNVCGWCVVIVQWCYDRYTAPWTGIGTSRILLWIFIRTNREIQTYTITRGVNCAQKKHTEASSELYNIPILRTTCKRKKKEYGKYSTHCVQGICQVCYTGRPTTYYSPCEERDGEQIIFVKHGVEKIVLRSIMNLNIQKIESTILCNSIFFIM